MVEARLLRIDDRGFLQVFVHPATTFDGAVAAIQAAGGTVERVDDEARLVQARVEISRLQGLSEAAAIQLVRLPDYGFTHAGSVTSEGDSILRANLARSTFGTDGTGVKVGVISDGVGGIGTSQASGDLPAVNTITCDIGPGDPQSHGAEGTAMLEIVHDLAPGAELWFGDFDFGTLVEFNAAVDCLAANTDVVVDDIGFFNVGPYDGTSVVSSNTSDALNQGSNPIRAYANAIGNEALSHYQETYVQFSPADASHRFSPTAATADALGLGPQNFDPLFLVAGGIVIIQLQWNDPFGASANDYDLFLFRDSDAALVAQSIDEQSGAQNPTEAVAFQNTGSDGFFDIVIDKFAGAPRTFDMFIHCSGCAPLPNGVFGQPIHNFNTPGSSVPANSDAGGGVISAGTINASDPGNDTIAPYSSRGPTNDGRTKPDISGIDGVSITGNGGFSNPFFGTSAAAPHIAGIAALLLQCQPHLKAGEPADNPAADRIATRNALLNTAVDLGANGMDNVFGAGRGDALTALGEPPSGPAPPLPSPSFFHPVTPARILDTRSGPGPTGKLAQGCFMDVQVTGVGEVPASDVTAVVLNTTVTETTAGSFLTVYPSDVPRPLASNLNFPAGQTVPNLVTVKVGANGKVRVFNAAGQTHIVFDVVGWYGPVRGSRFNALTPKRILDTRIGLGAPAAKVGQDSTITVDVTNTFGSGVPANGVTAVVVNTTVTEPTAGSFLTVYPQDPRPLASNLNFAPGQTVPNLVIVKVDPGGNVKVYNAVGSTHVILDVVGWYEEASGALFNPLPPSRFLDTRTGPQGTPPGKVQQDSEIAADVTKESVPGTATGVIVNTTVTEPTAGSFLTVFPSDALRPLASNLNFTTGQTVPNLVMVKVGADGNVRVYNAVGQAHVIFDVVGYFQ